VLFFGKLLHIGKEIKTLANPTNGFLRIFKKNLPYLEKKKSRSHQI
jgi:hypothetical protein